MTNKVISYHPQPYGDYQLGFCEVDMSGRCQMVLKVLRSRQGNIYCAFASVGFNNSWFPCFSYKDKGQEKDFLNGCLEQVKAIMAEQEKSEQQAHAQEAPTEQHSKDGMPF